MNTYVVALGLRIKEKRLAALHTQASLAKCCKIYRNYLSNIETGKANPTLSVLMNIASQLDIPLWQLMQTDSQGEWVKVKVAVNGRPVEKWAFIPSVGLRKRFKSKSIVEIRSSVFEK